MYAQMEALLYELEAFVLRQGIGRAMDIRRQSDPSGSEKQAAAEGRQIDPSGSEKLAAAEGITADREVAIARIRLPHFYKNHIGKTQPMMRTGIHIRLERTKSSRIRAKFGREVPRAYTMNATSDIETIEAFKGRERIDRALLCRTLS